MTNAANVADRPVVLVHGIGGTAATTWGQNGWLDLIADSGRPALGIDLLGHGTAPKPHDPAAYAQMHVALLDQMPEGPVDAIGFSLGARVLLEAAVLAPERFARLALTGVGRNLFVRDDERSAQIAAAIRGEGDVTDPFVRYFADLANDPDSDAEALKALLQAPGELFSAERLAPVTMPVLVVLGDKDFAGPAAPLVDSLADARHVELRNTDHFATPRSMDCLDAVLGFLDASPF